MKIQKVAARAEVGYDYVKSSLRSSWNICCELDQKISRGRLLFSELGNSLDSLTNDLDKDGLCVYMMKRMQ